MLGTVVLVACLLGGVAAQDFPLGRAAYIQLMSGCLGETSYREYLDSVAVARRECGGGVDEQGFLPPGLANVFISPSGRFPPGQGIPVFQPGTPVLQGSPGISQVPGVFTPSRLNPHQPGIFSQPGGFPSQAGILSQQQGLLSQQQGLLSQQPGILAQQAGLAQHPGILAQQAGTIFQQPGILTSPSGIFSSVLDTQSRKTPDAITDSVPPISSPVGPDYPGIRQKRQVALSLADIEQTRENMRAHINNFTCILNKLAVVSNNLDLNYPGLTNSVVNLPVDRELKRDLLKSINYCKDLTQCLPLDNLQLPVPHKLKRIMNYVKCEKEMRLKACHKHTLRQNLLNLSGLPKDASQFNTIEDIVNLLVDAQSSHELELI